MGNWNFKYKRPGPTIEAAEEEKLQLRTPAKSGSISQTFGQAFREARRTLGPNGVFEWHGKKYTTQLAEEANNKRPNRMDELNAITSPGVGAKEFSIPSSSTLGTRIPLDQSGQQFIGPMTPSSMEDPTGRIHEVPFAPSRFVHDAPLPGQREYGNPDKEKVEEGIEIAKKSIWQKLQMLFSSVQHPLFQDETWSKDKYNQ
jgi:hypothetical protein